MHEKRGFIITRLVAVDKDTGLNGQIRYGIIKGNSADLFKVRPDTGELYLDRQLGADNKVCHTVLLEIYCILCLTNLLNRIIPKLVRENTFYLDSSSSRRVAS